VGRRLAGALLGVVAILGLRLFSQTPAHDDVKARLEGLCATDTECLAAVAQHYEACFDSANRAGGGRERPRLDVDALVRCVNDRSGVPYFFVSSEAR
jgi:hypothetical protein